MLPALKKKNEFLYTHTHKKTLMPNFYLYICICLVWNELIENVSIPERSNSKQQLLTHVLLDKGQVNRGRKTEPQDEHTDLYTKVSYGIYWNFPSTPPLTRVYC